MNIHKILTAGLLALAFCASPLRAQTDGLTSDDTLLTHFETNNPQSGIGVDVNDFLPVKACYVGNQDMFVVIDSIDNSVDIIFRSEKMSFDTTIRVLADEPHGRHDLANILRPQSVGFVDGYVLYLASSKKDSSFLSVLDLDGNEVNRVSFNCCSYAFKVFPDEIIVVGRNQLGYDINVLDLSNGVANISTDEGHSARMHYHVPKQADRIRESDPIGIGLTVVAVSVVFLALLCISLILKGYGKLIIKAQDRKANKAAAKSVEAVATPSASETSGEIYAAIAAAIYMYDEEMHDEENTIITIQKVERAWTPWNAKFYNMNHYFNNNKR
ncbi:MAG: OadG family protein [Bacteroidales bacterium]|nr:OadG family protein [Bacteroidales bacterium]